MQSPPKDQFKQACAIIHCLVLGIDPDSGQVLPKECVVNKIDVNRALSAGINAIEQIAARSARRALLPGNVGRSWTTEEERSMIELFKGGTPIAEIAAQHGRTVRAIEARLEKIGLITGDQRSTSNSFLSAAAKKDDE